MHKLRMYEGLREMLEREVAEIEKSNNLDEKSLDHLYKIMTAIKVADKCIDRENGMSQDSYGRSYGGSYDGSYGGSYGSSYARRGRDGDGDGRYNERGSYQSRGSYGEQRDMLTQKLQGLMDEAKNEHERKAIAECLEKL